MDYFPLPLNPIHPIPHIDLCQSRDLLVDGDILFDGTKWDLQSYPEKHTKYSRRKVKEWCKLFADKPDDFVALLERWTVFGTLSTYFQTPILRSKCIRPSTASENSVLTLAIVPSLIHEFYMEALKGKTEIEEIRLSAMIFGKINTLLSVGRADDIFPQEDLNIEAEESLYEFIERHSKIFRDPRRPEIAMVATALFETIGMALGWRIEAGEGGDDDNTSTFVPAMMKSGSLPWIQLQQDGWCPLEIATLFGRFNTASLHYMHFISRPKPEEIHYTESMHAHTISASIGNISSSSPAKGNICNPFRCRYRTIDNKSYETAHAPHINCHDSSTSSINAACSACLASCLNRSCKNIKVNIDQLSAHLRAGKIPLIHCNDSITKDGEKLEIIERNKEPYVAISHIWADGLGNLEENAFPQCQILRLSKLVSSLGGLFDNIKHFWLDTLCVPPDDANMPLEQGLAMGLMRDVYADAAAVLVLDSWLLNTYTQGMSDLEILLRIFASTWNSRLWTFQEGALAEALFFQFADGPYNLDDGLKRLEQSNDPIICCAFRRGIRKLALGLRGFNRQENLKPTDKLMLIAESLYGRTTSVESDEPLCLSVLLDLDVTKVFEAKTGRMEKFWEVFGQAPHQIIFSKASGLDSDGLRWAPRSFLTSEANRFYEKQADAFDQQGPMATLIPRGLIVESSGITFLTETYCLSTTFWIVDQDKHVFSVHTDELDPTHSGRQVYRRHHDGRPAASGINPWGMRNHKMAGIIMKTPHHLDDTIFGLPGGYGSCLLVTIESKPKSDGVIYCQKACTALLERRDDKGLFHKSANNKVIQKFLEEGGLVQLDQNGGVINLVSGTKLRSKTKWCLA